MSYELFEAITANGDSAVHKINAKNTLGGLDRFLEFSGFMYGTFGGGTCKLLVAPKVSGPWFDIPNVTATADALINFQLKSDLYIKANLTGATAPSLTFTVL